MHPVLGSRCHRTHVGSAISSCCKALLVPSQHLVCGGTGCVSVAARCVEIAVCGSQIREAGCPIPKAGQQRATEHNLTLAHGGGHLVCLSR